MTKRLYMQGVKLPRPRRRGDNRQPFNHELRHRMKVRIMSGLASRVDERLMNGDRGADPDNINVLWSNPIWEKSRQLGMTETFKSRMDELRDTFRRDEEHAARAAQARWTEAYFRHDARPSMGAAYRMDIDDIDPFTLTPKDSDVDR